MIPARGEEQKKVISYGSCQFPTLGFVVDRYLRVRNFVPETFWLIRVVHEKDDINVKFTWRRGHLFDRMAVVIIFERCLLAKLATVTKMQKKPTKKWKPLPLTTVELQKMGSRFLRMSSQDVMTAAEALYTKGWISYPRTETDQFDRGMDLRALADRQQQDNHWGAFAQGLMNGGFKQPREGRNNDKAHPPIHPVNYVVPTTLDDRERRVYEFVVRRFLACCSEDAVGEATDVEIDYGGEGFHSHGLTVLARNYLDVYPYDKWESSQDLPQYTVGETFEPKEATMHDGKTTAPGYLTEPELIALMDANGIGTDATMAEHIAKIKDREYVVARPKGGAAAGGNVAERGGGRARGRGGRSGRGGRGGAAPQNGGGAAGGMLEFIPTTLGVALMEGYDNVGFETSLSKPFLRKEVQRRWHCEEIASTNARQMEVQMKAICEGRSTRNDVVQQNLEQYRAVFMRTTQQINVLKAVRPTPISVEHITNVERCTAGYSEVHCRAESQLRHRARGTPSLHVGRRQRLKRSSHDNMLWVEREQKTRVGAGCCPWLLFPLTPPRTADAPLRCAACRYAQGEIGEPLDPAVSAIRPMTVESGRG
jgi:DNA topoisomerase-3